MIRLYQVGETCFAAALGSLVERPGVPLWQVPPCPWYPAQEWLANSGLALYVLARGGPYQIESVPFYSETQGMLAIAQWPGEPDSHAVLMNKYGVCHDPAYDDGSVLFHYRVTMIAGLVARGLAGLRKERLACPFCNRCYG